MHHHTWLIFLFFVEMGSCHVAWTGLKLLDSNSLALLPRLECRGVISVHYILSPGSNGVSLCPPGWSTVVLSRLTATSASWVQLGEKSHDSPAASCICRRATFRPAYSAAAATAWAKSASVKKEPSEELTLERPLEMLSSSEAEPQPLIMDPVTELSRSPTLEAEAEFHHVGQADLELLNSGDPLSSASRTAGITSMSYCAQ
ncbi:hypothetical protein AAY473_014931, partial [Plecturocebus cupreus]